MSAPLLVPFIIALLLVSHIPRAVAQNTSAVCNSGFEWMTNSKGQNPCLVSSWLFSPCSSPADSFVYPLNPGSHYNTPWNTTQSATPCRCNTVLFSTIAACATCQGGADNIVPWIVYSQNCSNVYIQQYPEKIPSGTAVPAWAYLDITVNGTFNPVAAEAVAAQNLPESSASPSPSQTSNPTATIPTSPSTTTIHGGTSGSPTPTATGDDNSSSPKKKSNAGPIAGGVVGGVVGGVAGLALIGLGVFLVLRHRRNSSFGGQKSISPYMVYGAGTQTWEKSPMASVSTHRFYNPNDPSTFPARDPYASGSVQAPAGYLSADASAGAVSGSFADGHRGSSVTTPNPYRGAPEL